MRSFVQWLKTMRNKRRGKKTSDVNLAAIAKAMKVAGKTMAQGEFCSCHQDMAKKVERENSVTPMSVVVIVE